MVRKIAVVCDHRGIKLANSLQKYLISEGYDVLMVKTDNAADDYADNAMVAINWLKKGNIDRAILICGTGAGMAIVANRCKHIFAVHASSEAEAYFARRHEDVNVLALGAGYSDSVMEIKMSTAKAKKIVDAFLNTPFEGGRHIARLDKIRKIVE